MVVGTEQIPCASVAAPLHTGSTLRRFRLVCMRDSQCAICLRYLVSIPALTTRSSKTHFTVWPRRFHPDVNSGDALAERRFIEISQAYDTLRHPKTRAAYELGLTHQRKKARRRISNAAMTGFATSMLSTIVISFMMIWLLTDSKQVSQMGKSRVRSFGKIGLWRRPRKAMQHGLSRRRARRERGLYVQVDVLVWRSVSGRGGLQWS